jgi:hypothetical protein
MVLITLWLYLFPLLLWKSLLYHETFKAQWSLDALTGFNIQQLYILPTLYLCVLHSPQKKQRLLPYISKANWFL